MSQGFCGIFPPYSHLPAGRFQGHVRGLLPHLLQQGRELAVVVLQQGLSTLGISGCLKAMVVSRGSPEGGKK